MDEARRKARDGAAAIAAEHQRGPDGHCVICPDESWPCEAYSWTAEAAERIERHELATRAATTEE